jgi:3-oxoacyl-[acyl-carrier protein] reductase/meso-butanediol dehydrogenase/(S,S)-butanediol dehydrogenase/diacetyl reductase
MSRTVIITGGSKGIGWGLVQTFASNGYKVVSGSRSFLNEVPKEIDANIKQIEIDVKNKEDHIKLVKTAFDWTGKLDCYINNAGYSEWRDLRSIDEPFLTEIFQTNLFAYFWGAQAAITAMTDGGSILNISSLAAKRGTSNNSAYSATKFGVTGLTQSLCKELGPKGIRVNAVCPVLVETPGLITALNSDKSPAGLDSSKFLNDFAKSQSALGRLPTINEVAELCLFLSSEKASGITGQSINIDCGVLPN